MESINIKMFYNRISNFWCFRNLSDSSCVVVAPHTQTVNDMELLREKRTQIERLIPLVNPFQDLELSIKACFTTYLDEQQKRFVRYNTSKKEVILIIYVVLIKIFRCRSPTKENQITNVIEKAC